MCNSDASVAARLLPVVILCLTMFAGCPRMQQWRDSQIATSNRLAQGDRIVVPAPPITIADKVRRQLPLDPLFQLVTYQATSGDAEITLTALSPWSVTETCQWMLARMQQQGYDCDQNPSEILNGVTFLSADQAYGAVMIQVTLNTADQCLINIETRRK